MIKFKASRGGRVSARIYSFGLPLPSVRPHSLRLLMLNDFRAERLLDLDFQLSVASPKCPARLSQIVDFPNAVGLVSSWVGVRLGIPLSALGICGGFPGASLFPSALQI